MTTGIYLEFEMQIQRRQGRLTDRSEADPVSAAQGSEVGLRPEEGWMPLSSPAHSGHSRILGWSRRFCLQGASESNKQVEVGGGSPRPDSHIGLKQFLRQT